MLPARRSRGRTHQSRQVLGTEENDLRSVHGPWVRTKYLAEDWELNDQGRSNIVEIPVNNVVVLQVLHTGQGETEHNTKSISSALLSAGYGILIRKMVASAETPKEFAVDSEIQSEVDFCL